MGTQRTDPNAQVNPLTGQAVQPMPPAADPPGREPFVDSRDRKVVHTDHSAALDRLHQLSNGVNFLIDNRGGQVTKADLDALKAGLESVIQHFEGTV